MRVIKADEEHGVTVRTIKTLGGKEVPSRMEIRSFYLLDLCSTSGGHGPDFGLKEGRHYYLLLKDKGEEGLALATPTAGFAL